ncbi:MAG TPA: NUDIX domain-containing protein [Bacteroidia bacterium]|nr:NUDIX domain-containing protein [Bacteroidia bacterium]
MKKYNIRVYALIIHKGKILVTDEFRGNMRMTKFPGGGNEWGEGLIETLKRECVEELAQEPVSIEHFYTTDFFVASAFNSNDQMISVYYKVSIPYPEKIEVVQNEFDFPEEKDGAQIFRWLEIDRIHPDQFTFPIDKKVAGLLRK